MRSDHRVPIPEGDYTTLGGYVFSRLGRLPKLGERVPYPGGELEVVAMNGRRVAALRVHRTPAADAPAAAGEPADVPVTRATTPRRGTPARGRSPDERREAAGP